MRHFEKILTSAIFAALPMFASAATVVNALDNTCFGFAESNSSASNQQIQVGGSGSDTDNIGRTCGTFAKSVAGGGFVGIDLKATSAGQRSSVGAFASWSDTFSITAPANYTGGAIDVSVLFHYDALIFQNVPNNATSNAGTSVNYRTIFSAQSSGSTLPSQVGTFSDRVAVLENRPSDPSLVALNLPGVFQFNVRPGIDTLTLGISLQATANAGAPDGTASAEFLGLNTASLAKDGPAFILPEGFFVTNEAANVYNNFWVDPRNPSAPSPVPLPAGALLMLTGLGGIAALCRRKKRVS